MSLNTTAKITDENKVRVLGYSSTPRTGRVIRVMLSAQDIAKTAKLCYITTEVVK